MKKITLRRIYENECIYRDGWECTDCGYCDLYKQQKIKRLDCYYDNSLQMMLHKYKIISNENFKIGDVISLTFEDDEDCDTYDYKIVQKNNNEYILIEFYSNYCIVKPSCVAFDRGVKTIDALKDLQIIL